MGLPIDPTPSALLLNGTVGVGKTTVAEAVGELLQAGGGPGAVIDADWLRRCWPAPEDDPFQGALMLRNLAAVVAGFRAAGASHIVVAGVVETPAERESHAAAIGLPLVQCRLRVDLDTVQHRLRWRHRSDPDGLSWHLDRSGELEDILDAADVDDFTVDATHLDVTTTAVAVLRGAGWLTDQGSDSAAGRRNAR